MFDPYANFVRACESSFRQHSREILSLYGGYRIKSRTMMADMTRIAETCAIEIALSKCRGCQTQAADMLGINRNTLKYRINKYDIDYKRFIPTE